MTGVGGFQPSTGQGAAMRSAMSRALWDSLVSLGVLAPEAAAGFGKDRAPAQAFGAYSDIALLPARDAALAEQLRSEAAAWFATPPAQPAALPRVGTMAAPDYRPDEVARFERWWDIEPDNAMALTAVAATELPGCRALIGRAMEVMAGCAPELHGEIAEIVGEIVILRPGPGHRMEFGGVSSFALWGAVAINLDCHDHWIKFYQKLTHEAAHLLLFALAREGPLVGNPPSERAHSTLRAQLRPLDGVYHAAFVSARESLALDQLLIAADAGIVPLTDDERARAEYLLASSVTSFWGCRDTVREDAHLTPLGEALLAECEDYMAANFTLAEA